MSTTRMFFNRATGDFHSAVPHEALGMLVPPDPATFEAIDIEDTIPEQIVDDIADSTGKKDWKLKLHKKSPDQPKKEKEYEKRLPNGHVLRAF